MINKRNRICFYIQIVLLFLHIMFIIKELIKLPIALTPLPIESGYERYIARIS